MRYRVCDFFKTKGLLLIVALGMILSLLTIPTAVQAEAGTVIVDTKEAFQTAIAEKKATTIELSESIDITGVGVLDVDGLTIDLGGNKISANNFTAIFQGDNFKIMNGEVDSNGGAYALFIGDMRTTENILIENITATGGINVFNAHDVTLRNVTATGTSYYAVWCDENAFITIESGTFQSNGVAVLGTAEVVEDLDVALTIKDGIFNTNQKPLVLEDSNTRMEVAILGGRYDIDPSKYMKDEYKVYEKDGQYVVAPMTTGISLDKENASIRVGETVTLHAVLEPADTLDTVHWTTDDETVAVVENGIVTAKGVGTATITAQVGTYSASCLVTVKDIPDEEKITNVALDKTNASIEVGEAITLHAVLEPSDVTVDVEWLSDNEAVAVVENGIVTAKGVGTATITARVGVHSASCLVTVKDIPDEEKITNVALDKTNASIEVGEAITLHAVLEPSDVTVDVEWLSDNEAVAVVENGVVTAKGVGIATITAQVGVHSASCLVTVKDIPAVDKITDVILDKTNASIEVGEAITLHAVLEPSDVTVDVEWLSDNETVAVVENGIVTAKGAGTATITAQVGSHRTSCFVTVYEIHEPLISVEEKTGITIDSSAVNEIREKANQIVADVKAGKDVANIVFADDEAKAKLSSATHIGIEVITQPLNENSVKKEDLNIIKNSLTALSNEDNSQWKLSQYLDVSILLKINQQVIGNITSLDHPITLTVKIADHLIQQGRIFYILRVHDGAAEKIGVYKNGAVTFETDKFSTYALIYKDVEATASENETIEIPLRTFVDGKEVTGQNGELTMVRLPIGKISQKALDELAVLYGVTDKAHKLRGFYFDGEAKERLVAGDEISSDVKELYMFIDSNEKESTASGISDTPNTSDNTMIGSFVLLAIMNAAFLLYLALRKKKTS